MWIIRKLNDIQDKAENQKKEILKIQDRNEKFTKEIDILKKQNSGNEKFIEGIIKYSRKFNNRVAQV